MSFLFDLLSTGALTPLVAERIELDQAAEAHELLSSGSVAGRIMLVVS